MRTHNPFYVPLSIAVAVILVAAMICFGQHAFGQQLTQQDQPVPAEVDMRWKFAPDDVFRVEMRVKETIVDDQDEQFQNQRIYNYRWTVESVDSEANAIISVSFDHIQFRSEWPPFTFDSRTDDPTVGTAVGDEMNSLLFDCRAMMSSRFTIKVTPQGAVRQIAGAESVFGPMAYTPGDLAALPEQPVKVGDSWFVETGSDVDSTQLRGRATYRLVQLERNGGKDICHIEGENISPAQTGLPGDSHVRPIPSLSRFDPEAGQFLNEEVKTQVRAEIAPGDFVTLSQDIQRRFFPREKRVVEAVDSGSYIFQFDGEGPHSLILGGAQVGAPIGPMGKMFDLKFFHVWSDTDGDRQPAPDELSGITTRFAAGEPVRFIVYAIGLKDAKLHVNLLDNHGEQLGSSNIPTKTHAAFAVRTLPDLEPGVYFQEFFVNDRHLVRVPVQVYSELDEAELAPDDMQAVVERGITHLFEKRIEEAIRDFSHAIEGMPDEPDLYVFRGSALNEKADYDAAIADFTRAIQLNPDQAEALAYRGVSWLEKGNDSEAVADFDAAVELDPHCEVAFANRGSFWLQRGDYAKAIADYKQALQINPARDTILNAIAEVLATCPDAQFRDGEEALRFARRACMSSEWENHEYFATLAAAYAEVGDFESAIRWQRQSVDKAPSELQDEGQQRLDLYRAGKPYRTEKI